MTLWLGDAPVVLASKSVIRRQVLEQAGLPVEIMPADVDERGLEAAAGPLSPKDAAVMLARAKALAIASTMPDRIVIGADQVLALGLQRFSKPKDRAAARAQLLALRGATHHLHAGWALAMGGAIVVADVASAALTMRGFSERFLDRYLDEAGDVLLASVGGYQLEALGPHLFERIEGDHFTILGLPLMPLLAALRANGLVAD